MVGGGRTMRIQTGIVVLGLLTAATVVAAPQASQTAAPRDPELIDAQAYQKLLEQNRGKPLLVNFWATYCEPCRDEYPDRKSTRLNSSHSQISYAVFCLKKKKTNEQ